MPQLYRGLFGVLALGATLGAAQLASGHDLADRWQAVADKPSAHNVNRSAKADRLAEARSATGPTRTVSMRLNDLAETSVLLRVPASAEIGNAKPALTVPRQGRSKPTIACEPVVSALTDVSKLLQPGRCVT